MRMKTKKSKCEEDCSCLYYFVINTVFNIVRNCKCIVLWNFRPQKNNNNNTNDVDRVFISKETIFLKTRDVKWRKGFIYLFFSDMWRWKHRLLSGARTSVRELKILEWKLMQQHVDSSWFMLSPNYFLFRESLDFGEFFIITFLYTIYSL